MEFENRDAALMWVIKNQFGRRNLSAYDRSILALKLKPLIAAKAKEKQGTRTDLKNKEYQADKNTKDGSLSSNFSQISDKSSTATPTFIKSNIIPSKVGISAEVEKPKSETRTDFQVAKLANVSRDTINKVEKIQATASDEVKAALKTGDMSINQAYKEIKKAEKEQHQAERAERKAYTLETEMPQEVRDFSSWSFRHAEWGDKTMETVNSYAQNFFLLWQAGFISNETFEDFQKVWEEINYECANVEHEREMAKTKFDF
jgi:hypothetical protein